VDVVKWYLLVQRVSLPLYRSPRGKNMNYYCVVSGMRAVFHGTMPRARFAAICLLVLLGVITQGVLGTALC
jgi:hypothetical protein